MTGRLLTPPGTPSTRADRILAAVCGGMLGAMAGQMFMRLFVFGMF